MMVLFFRWPSVPLGEGINPTGNQRFAKQPAITPGPLFPEGYAPQRNCARLPSGFMEDKFLLGAGWNGHDWIEPKARLVRVATGYSVVQRRCARCHRDFIFTPSSERNAVFVSAVSFFLLDEEVTNRWVNLPCPGRRLLSDDDDRKRRIAELGVFHKPEIPEMVRNLGNRASIHNLRSR
jgi:hypothetical protein